MADGHASFHLTVCAEHMNPHGVVHGGIVYTLGDYARGGALTSRLEPGERCATLEVKINYLAPVTEGGIRAEARVVERTRRIGVLEAASTMTPTVSSRWRLVLFTFGPRPAKVPHRLAVDTAREAR